MIFLLFSFCLFQTSEKTLIVRDTDKLSLYFTGFKSNRQPFIYDFAFHNSLCERGIMMKTKQTPSENILGEFSAKMPFEINFLQEFESDCYCGHNLTNIQISYINSLILDNYFYTFNIENKQNLQLSSNFEKGLKIGTSNGIFNTITFHINYKKLNKTESTYEIISFTGEETSILFEKKDSEKNCVPVKRKSQTLEENQYFMFKFYVEFNEIKDKKEEPEKIPFAQEIHTNITFLIIIHIIVLIFIIFIAFSDCFKTSTNPLDEDIDESIWYFLRGDIFRPPQTIHFLCTFAGSGVQICLSLILTSLLKSFRSYSDILSLFLSVFAWLGFFGGFSGMKFFKLIGGFEWRSVFSATLSLIPCYHFLLFSIRSFIFYCFDAAGSPTFATVFHVLYLCTIHCLTSALGMYISLKLDFDTAWFKVNMIPKQIPNQPFYLNKMMTYILSSFYIFANLFKIIRFLYQNVWNGQLFSCYRTTMTNFVFLLFLLSAEVSIFFVYLQVKNGNYKWWWTAFGCSSSIGFGILLYSLFFFKNDTNLELCFSSITLYLSSNLFIGFLISLLCGAFGLFSTTFFLWRVYSGFTL